MQGIAGLIRGTVPCIKVHEHVCRTKKSSKLPGEGSSGKVSISGPASRGIASRYAALPCVKAVSPKRASSTSLACPSVNRNGEQPVTTFVPKIAQPMDDHMCSPDADNTQGKQQDERSDLSVKAGEMPFDAYPQFRFIAHCNCSKSFSCWLWQNV